jgi:site-specific recombinase
MLQVWENLRRMGKGEVARSNPACMRALLAAGGAGALTAGTVVLKVLILHHPFNALTLGVLGTLNFAASFLLMQAFGFKLATKLSPLFGVALGKHWKNLGKRINDGLAAGMSGGLSHRVFGQEIGWSLKTQAMGAMGNLFFVIPAALVFHIWFRHSTGQSFLDQASATKMLASFNPWTTKTIVYAAFTGFLLWVCTVVGGAAAHRMKPFSKTLATALFNILLGALLAFTPVLGKLSGIPIDVRHFTLTGGCIAIATASVGIHGAFRAGLGAALLGLLFIGFLNFSVGFFLAFLSSVLSADVPALEAH